MTTAEASTSRPRLRLRTFEERGYARLVRIHNRAYVDHLEAVDEWRY